MSKNVIRATHGDLKRPMRIGDIEIPCYVLADGRRVISQRGLQSGLGMNATGGARRLVKFVVQIGANPSMVNDLTMRIMNPIKFLVPHGGAVAHGYEATMLADICDAVLEARKIGKLHRQQAPIAKQCEILMRGFAVVGIIALVDEATGYQQDRARQALAEILERYISAQLVKWAKTFPDDFYQEMFRLKGWDYLALADGKRPGVVGRYTRELVYARLAPGVVEELERKNPTVSPGQRRTKHHQYLTSDVGHPALREHLSGVIAVMKVSRDWAHFQRNVKKVYPKVWEQTELDFPDDQD